MNINYKGYECTAYFGKYHDGNNAIQLIGKEGTEYEGELITTASVNGEIKLSDDVVGIKTWSENEGIVKSLVDGGIIEPLKVGLEPSGFVLIEYYRLTKEALNEIAKTKEEEK